MKIEYRIYLGLGLGKIILENSCDFRGVAFKIYWDIRLRNFRCIVNWNEHGKTGPCSW